MSAVPATSAPSIEIPVAVAGEAISSLPSKAEEDKDNASARGTTEPRTEKTIAPITEDMDAQLAGHTPDYTFILCTKTQA